MDSDLERAFDTQWRILGDDLPDPKSHHIFHPDRKWALDRAWPKYMVAVELEGGAKGQAVKCHACGVRVRAMRNDGQPGKVIHTAGWHSRPQRFQSDKTKYNSAEILGWTLLRYTHDDVYGDPYAMVCQIREALEARECRVNLIDNLSSREEQVLHLIAAGFVTVDISAKLEISENTVRGHSQNLCQKLITRNRPAAVARAAAWGLLDFQRIPWQGDDCLLLNS